MKFANILPFSLMYDPYLNDTGIQVFSAIQMGNNEYYRNFARECAYRGDTIILNHDVVEENHSPVFEHTIDIANTLKLVDYVVLPDVLHDAKLTLHLAKKAINKFPLGSTKMAYMAVPQATDMTEFLECYDALIQIKSIHAIGFSKHIEEWCPTGRLGLVAYLIATGRMQPNLHYHLLGMTTPDELFIQASRHSGWIGSISSAFPTHVGLRGRRMDSISPSGTIPPALFKPHRQDNFFEIDHTILPAAYYDLIRINTKTYAELATGTPYA